MLCFRPPTIQAEADRFSSHTVLIADYQAGEYTKHTVKPSLGMRACAYSMPLPWVASLADAGACCATLYAR